MTPPPGVSIDTEALLRLRHLVAEARRAAPARATALPGPIATRRRGRGSEPDDIRLWSHGDDIRHIDRNTTARTGVPHVRTFRSEQELTTLLVADFRAPMLFGTRRAFRSVAAAEVLALAGWRAVGLGAKVALLAVGGPEPLFVRAAAGDRAMLAVIGGLHRAHAEALEAADGIAAPLVETLDLAASLLPRGGTIVMATGLEAPGEALDRRIRQVGHRFDLRVALISDAFERAPPRGLYPFLTLEGARGVHVVRGGRPGSHAGIERLQSLGANAVRFDAEVPPDSQMHALGDLHGDFG